jgi:hypothetical protein
MRAVRLVVLTALHPAPAGPRLRARRLTQRGGLPDARWLSRHCTSLPLAVAQ